MWPRQSDRQTERQTCGAVCVALELSNFSPGGGGVFGVGGEALPFLPQ